jgi:hypothetical protein
MTRQCVTHTGTGDMSRMRLMICANGSGVTATSTIYRIS